MKLQALGIALAAFAVHSSAATLTVGADGTHSTLQEALDVALGTAGDDVIKVQSGTYVENVFIDSNSSDHVTVSGGWNSTFTVQTRSDSILSPATRGTALELHRNHGAFVIGNLTVKNAHANECAGIRIAETGDSSFTLDGLAVSGNIAEHAGDTVFGGGGCIEATGSGEVDLTNSVFDGNVARAAPGATPGYASGGGLSAVCVEPAVCHIVGVRFSGNRVEPNGGYLGHGGGLDVVASSAALGSFLLRDAVFETQGFGGDYSLIVGVSLSINLLGAADASVDRVRFLGSGTPEDPNYEVVLVANAQSIVKLFNSLFAQITRVPLVVESHDGANAWLGQNTFADNAYGPFVTGSSSNALALYDNIFWNPAASIDHFGHVATNGLVTLSHNLTGVDPDFLAPWSFDYSLQRTGSPAMDQGDPGVYPFSTDGLDLAGLPRWQGAAIDIGAYESSDRVFASLFDP